MKGINIIILLFTFFSCTNKIVKKYNPPIDSILMLTKDDLTTYIVVIIVDPDVGQKKLLLTNRDFHWNFHPKLNYFEGFLDTLSSTLELNIICKPKTKKIIESYKIDDKLLDKLYLESFQNVLLNHFDNKGVPIQNIPENEMKAAVTYLIENGVIVNQNQYVVYTISELWFQ